MVHLYQVYSFHNRKSIGVYELNKSFLSRIRIQFQQLTRTHVAHAENEDNFVRMFRRYGAKH